MPIPASVPSVPRSQMLKAASGGVNGQVVHVQSSKGHIDLPVVVPPTSAVNADYYRNGRSNATDGYLAKTIDSLPDAPASIRVFGRGTGKPNGKEQDFIPAYTKFILNSTQEGHQEKVQIVETFSDFYVFFYGERPPIYTYNGILINSKNANWVADFMYYYEEHIRGTKCAENNARLILTYGGRQVEGYILSVSLNTNAETEQGVPVSFQVVITKRNRIGFSDDFGLSTTNGKDIIDDDLRSILNAVAGGKGEGTSSPNTSGGFNAVNNVMKGLSPAARMV